MASAPALSLCFIAIGNLDCARWQRMIVVSIDDTETTSMEYIEHPGLTVLGSLT